MLEQYGRRNNIEISGVVVAVVVTCCFGEKVGSVFLEIGIAVAPNDIKACYRIGEKQNK